MHRPLLVQGKRMKVWVLLHEAWDGSIPAGVFSSLEAALHAGQEFLNKYDVDIWKIKIHEFTLDEENPISKKYVVDNTGKESIIQVVNQQLDLDREHTEEHAAKNYIVGKTTP